MNKILIIVPIIAMFVYGCTSQSIKTAQEAEVRSSAVFDGIHHDTNTALSRENYETTRLNILLNTEKTKFNMATSSSAPSKDVYSAMDQLAAANIDALKTFSKKRDMMSDWNHDYDLADEYRAVSVRAKLFNMVGILNYLGSQFSNNTKQVFNAFDAAKQTFNQVRVAPVTTQPAVR